MPASLAIAPPHTAAHTAPGEPFASVEAAWFWTMAALSARAAGTGRGGRSGTTRPCDPDDVLRALDQLYRLRRIDLLHARILRIWGERGMAPNPSSPREASDARIWREAMDRLDAKLRTRGLLA